MVPISNDSLPWIIKLTICISKTDIIPGMVPRKLPAIGPKQSKTVNFAEEPTKLVTGICIARMPIKVNRTVEVIFL